MLSVTDRLVSLTEFCYQSLIDSYCSPNHAIGHQYACIAHRIMLSLTNTLVLLTESCYQSPICSYHSPNDAISHQYACIAHQNVSHQYVCIAHRIMLSVNDIGLYRSPNRAISHWYACIAHRIVLSVTDRLMSLTESCNVTDTLVSLTESCYQSLICLYCSPNRAHIENEKSTAKYEVTGPGHHTL